MLGSETLTRPPAEPPAPKLGSWTRFALMNDHGELLWNNGPDGTGHGWAAAHAFEAKSWATLDDFVGWARGVHERAPGDWRLVRITAVAWETFVIRAPGGDHDSRAWPVPCVAEAACDGGP